MIDAPLLLAVKNARSTEPYRLPDKNTTISDLAQRAPGAPSAKSSVSENQNKRLIFLFFRSRPQHAAHPPYERGRADLTCAGALD
jgi:hypothetical protein